MISKHSANFPSRIDAFTLREPFAHPEGMCRYALAVYADAEGKEAVLKQWSEGGRAEDRARLGSEAHALKIFSALRSRDGAAWQERFPDIRLPQYIAYHAGRQAVWFLMERMPGNHIGTYPAALQTASIGRIAAFLDWAFVRLTAAERRSFTRRSPAYFLAMMFPAAWKAARRFPRFRSVIWRGVRAVISAAPALLSGRERTIVHRDLNRTNVLVAGQILSILDLQLIVEAHPYWELAAAAAIGASVPGFAEAFNAIPQMRDIAQDGHKRRRYFGYAAGACLIELAFGPGDRAMRGGEALVRLFAAPSSQP